MTSKELREKFNKDFHNREKTWEKVLQVWKDKEHAEIEEQIKKDSDVLPEPIQPDTSASTHGYIS